MAPGAPPAPQSEIAVDLLFDGPGPTFGDLFTITGHENPNFPPPRQFDFAQFTDLQVSQIGDYFGVRALGDVGEDIPIWLFPLVPAGSSITIRAASTASASPTASCATRSPAAITSST